MSSKGTPRFVRHIDSASYGTSAERPIMDEDDALERAESEIRRLRSLLREAHGLLEDWSRYCIFFDTPRGSNLKKSTIDFIIENK